MECHGLEMDTNSGISGIGTSFRNHIINGNFDMWQRGTSFTDTDFFYSADRWKHYVDLNGTTMTVSQQSFTIGQTDVPGEPTYYLRCNISAVGGLSDDQAQVYQAIEYIRLSAGKIMTVSFYAKADSTKTIAVQFYQKYGSTDGFNLTETPTQITLSTSWTKYEITMPISSISGHTIDEYDNYYGVVFFLSAGTDLDYRTGGLGSQTGIFDFAKIQCEISSVATEFEERPLWLEKLLCYRYYYETPVVGSGVYNSETQFVCPVNSPVPFRVSPTVFMKSGVYTNINIEHNDTYDISAISLAWTSQSKTEVKPILTLTVPTRSGYTGLAGMPVCDTGTDVFCFSAEI